MLFYVKYDNEEHRVRVENRRGKLFVSFDDEPEEEVDLVYQGNDCSFIRNHEVFFANVVGQQSEYTVWNPAKNMQFSVESEYRRIVGKLRGQDLQQDNRVTAKMPGKIARIMVKEGGTVKPGDGLIVMEAMKMENEIHSTIAGTVKRIRVKEGQAVESGALLIELNPS